MIISWVTSTLLWKTVAPVLTIPAEMSLNIDTVSGRIEADCPEEAFYGMLEHCKAKETFSIDGETEFTLLVRAFSPPFQESISLPTDYLGLSRALLRTCASGKSILVVSRL